MTRYLIDTSIWIDYFRNQNTALNDWIDRMIDDNCVHINGIVMVELLTGTRTGPEYDQLAAALHGLHFVNMNQPLFAAASRSGCQLKRKGVSVPLSDLLIATACVENTLTLVENDRHFGMLAKYLKLARYNPAGSSSH